MDIKTNWIEALCFNKILFLLFFLNGFHGVLAQNSLSGMVVDGLGDPIIGVNIFIPELKTGTSTDENGYYKLQYLPPQNLRIQVSYVGYETITQLVPIKGDTKKDFTLDEAHLETKEIVVTGLSVTQEKRRSPVSIDILKRDFLVKSSGTNLVNGLTKVPGVSAIGTGPGISKPIIRGLGYNRVLVVQDGIRQEGQQWGDEHGLEIDGYSVERVEVYRGPASLMYGSDGLGGVLHMESPHPPMKGLVEGRLSSAYFSNNRQREFSGFVTANKNGWNGYLLGTYRKAEDYQNAYDGKVFNSGFKETNGSGMIGVNRKWGYSHLHFSTFLQQPQLPEGERNTDGSFVTDAAPFQKINHNKIGWNSNFIFKNSSLKTVLGYQQNVRKEFEVPDEIGLHFDLHSFTYDAKYFISGNSGWEYTFGGSGMVQQSKNKGLEFLVPDYTIYDEGAFAYVRHPTEKMEWSGGIRLDFRKIQGIELVDVGNIRFAALEKNYGNWSGALGWGWFPSDHLAFKLNVAKGFRSPNVAELLSNGVHEGTFRYEIGNSELEAETNFELDAGLEVDLEHLTLAINPFFNQINHYIFLNKLAAVQGGDSLTIVENEAFPTFQFIQGKAYLTGGEITIDLHPHPYDWIHFKNTFSIVQARQQNSPNKYLPFIPPAKYQVELRADLPKEGQFFKNIFFETDFEYFFQQDQVLAANDFETPTPGYGLWNITAGLDWTNKSGEPLVNFIFSVQNILDKTYQNHLNRLKYAPFNPASGRRGIFNMGRNLMVKMILPLERKMKS